MIIVLRPDAAARDSTLAAIAHAAERHEGVSARTFDFEIKSSPASVLIKDAARIEKGSGEAGGAEFQTIVYEGYGPGGTALIIDALTDNNTRTVGEVRSIFKKAGGSMGNAGTVAFMFTTKGQIFIDANTYSEEQVMEAALEAGAEDIQSPEGEGDDQGAWTIVTEPTEFQSVKDAIEAAGIEIVEAEITRIPENTVEVGGDDVRKVMNLIDALEDNDDVQKVYSNADFDSEELAKLG